MTVPTGCAAGFDFLTGWTTGAHMLHPSDEALCNVPLPGGIAGFVISVLICSINSGAGRSGDGPHDREHRHDHYRRYLASSHDFHPGDLFDNRHHPDRERRKQRNPTTVH